MPPCALPPTCAPVHDALLIEAPLANLDAAVADTQAGMAHASAQVLGGFPLRSEAKLVRYPEHYTDARGQQMWETVWQIVAELESSPTTATTRPSTSPVAVGHGSANDHAVDFSPVQEAAA